MKDEIKSVNGSIKSLNDVRMGRDRFGLSKEQKRGIEKREWKSVRSSSVNCPLRKRTVDLKYDC